MGTFKVTNKLNTERSQPKETLLGQALVQSLQEGVTAHPVEPVIVKEYIEIPVDREVIKEVIVEKIVTVPIEIIKEVVVTKEIKVLDKEVMDQEIEKINKLFVDCAKEQDATLEKLETFELSLKQATAKLDFVLTSKRADLVTMKERIKILEARAMHTWIGLFMLGILFLIVEL